MMNRIFRIAAWLIPLFLQIACIEVPEEPDFHNPYFPNDPHYVAPEVYITDGPGEGDVIQGDYLTFRFDGNEVVTEYSYDLDDWGWSPWRMENMVSFELLDEGLHTFRVKGRTEAGIENDQFISRSFRVDAIHGPALWFSPREQTVNSGEEFTVRLMAEEVSDLMGLRVPISFDMSQLEMTEYKIFRYDNAFLRQNGGSVVALVDTLYNAGVYVFNIAVIDGEPEGVSGSGPIVELTFYAYSSQYTEIQFDTNCLYKDSYLNEYYFGYEQRYLAGVEVR